MYRENILKGFINRDRFGTIGNADGSTTSSIRAFKKQTIYSSYLMKFARNNERKIFFNYFKEQKDVEQKIKSKLKTLESAENLVKSSEKNTADYFKYGLAGTGQLVVKYPQLDFRVANFFALGSPISIFLTVRGIEKLDPDYKLPTCDAFFNIFHPVI